MSEIYTAQFHIKKSPVGSYYFIFVGKDNKSIITSKSFVNRSSLELCLAEIRHYIPVAEINDNTDIPLTPFFMIIHRKDINSFTFCDANREILFSSESFKSKEECIIVIKYLKENIPDAGVQDLF